MRDLEAFLDRPIHPRILSDEPSHAPEPYVPTDKRIKFCPCCVPQRPLELRQVEPDQERLTCDIKEGGCGWTYYDNPLMVSTGLVVFPERFIGEKNVRGPFDFRAADFFELGEHGLRLKPTGVAVIQRGRPPFVNGWAFAGGFNNWRETPRRSAFSELNQETGLRVCIRADAVVCACNPDPRILNQNTVTQLSIPIDGEMRAGDDAKDVQIIGRDTPLPLCFSSHTRTLTRWFRGRYAGLLKHFFVDPEEEQGEV